MPLTPQQRGARFRDGTSNENIPYRDIGLTAEDKMLKRKAKKKEYDRVR